MGSLLRDETGAQAVFVTSLESFQEQGPPKISLICRIVTTGPSPEILWMKGIGLSGDQSPGLLGLGLVQDSEKLIDMAVEALLDDLDAFLAGGFKSRSPASGVHHEPTEYGDPTLDEQDPLRFSNRSKYDPRSCHFSINTRGPMPVLSRHCILLKFFTVLKICMFSSPA
jgi:hypothetical protein